MPSIRQRFHLSPCSDFRSHFYLSSQEIRDYLTSKDIKLKKKEANIAGLQLADCIAHPSKLSVLEAHGEPLVAPISDAGRRINKALQMKYNRFGRVFLK